MAPRDTRDVATNAWDWCRHAEDNYRRARDGSAEESAAITAMAAAALAAMVAEQLR